MLGDQTFEDRVVLELISSKWGFLGGQFSKNNVVSVLQHDLPDYSEHIRVSRLPIKVCTPL